MPRETFPAFIRNEIDVGGAVGSFTGTGALTLIDSFKPGFRCALERLRFQNGVIAGAGAGATQTFRLRKGGPAGTIVATLVVALANAGAGKYLEATVTAASDAAARLTDTDVFSVTRDAGGTAFTTEPSGDFMVGIRQRPQGRI